MKNKIILGISSLAVAIVAFTAYTSTGTAEHNLLLQNVEALARAETGSLGTLVGNVGGNLYCCCAGTNSCGASDCSASICEKLNLKPR